MLNRQINVETGTRNQRKKKGTADSNAISAQRSAFRSKKKKKQKRRRSTNRYNDESTQHAEKLLGWRVLVETWKEKDGHSCVNSQQNKK